MQQKINQKGLVVRLFDSLVSVPSLRNKIWTWLYKLIVHFYRNNSWVFMNYGYAALDGNYRQVALKTNDEPNRYFIQLYDYILNHISLHKKHVLEVGCGRGGGASFLKAYHNPEIVIGVDRTPKVVDFCNRNHATNGLSFQIGDAHNLPFPTASFDAVINVESSHCYVSRPAFFNEVQRVLKPEGRFFFTDVVDSGQIDELRSQLQASNMKILKEEDITPNVIRALHEDGERRYRFFEKSMPRLVLRYFKEFAGDFSSKIYQKFTQGKNIYYHSVLQK